MISLGVWDSMNPRGTLREQGLRLNSTGITEVQSNTASLLTSLNYKQIRKCYCRRRVFAAATGTFHGPVIALGVQSAYGNLKQNKQSARRKKQTRRTMGVESESPLQLDRTEQPQGEPEWLKITYEWVSNSSDAAAC